MDDILGDELSAESVDPYLLGYADEIGEEFDGGNGEDWDFGAGEEYDFGEPEMAERRRGYRSRRTRRRARQRQLRAQRLAAQQRRQYGRRPSYSRPPSRPQRPSGRPASTQQVQKVAETVKNVDLDNKVLGDLVSKALNFERKRITRNQQAFMTSQFLDQIGASLATGPKPINWLSLAPMAFMVADKKKAGGIAGVLREPWAWTIISAVTLLILTNEEWRTKFRDILGGGSPQVPPPPAVGTAAPRGLQDALAQFLKPPAAAASPVNPQTAQQMAAAAIQQAAAPAIEQAAAQMLQQAVTPAVQQAAAEMVQNAFKQAAQQTAATATQATAAAAQQAGESTAKKASAKK